MVTKSITLYVVKSDVASKAVNSNKRALDLQTLLAEFGVTTEISKEVRKVEIDV